MAKSKQLNPLRDETGWAPKQPVFRDKPGGAIPAQGITLQAPRVSKDGAETHPPIPKAKRSRTW